MNRQGNRDRYPVLVGEADTFRRGLQQRQGPVPREVGLQPSEASLKPCEKGTSFFTTGYSEKLEIPGQSESFQEWKASADKDSAFSFHATQSDGCM